jgi:hypothetical protein
MLGQGIKYRHIRILAQSALNHTELISSSIGIWQCLLACNENFGCAGFVYSLDASCAIFDIATVNAAELQLGFGSEIIYIQEDLVNFD